MWTTELFISLKPKLKIQCYWRRVAFKTEISAPPLPSARKHCVDTSYSSSYHAPFSILMITCDGALRLLLGDDEEAVGEWNWIILLSGRWKCGSGKCRSRQTMESRKNKILSRLGLAAVVSARADQQFGTHSHRICEAHTPRNSNEA